MQAFQGLLMIEDDEAAWAEREAFMAEVYKIVQSWSATGNARKTSPVRIRREYLIENLIDRASLNVIYGPPKSCKTLIAQSMTHHLCTSEFWCNHRILHKCNVLYLGYEDPDSLKLRQAALAHNDESNFDENIGHVSIISSDIPKLPSDLAFLSIREFFSYLVDNGPDVHVNEVLFIDTLNMAFSHLGNENDAQFMSEIAKFARRLCELGITVFLIHHSVKDATKGLRGHTALSGAVDNIFRCNIKGKDKVEMTQEMWRNGPKGKKINFSIKEIAVACIAPNGVRSMSCPVVLSETVAASPSLSLNSSEIKFLKAMNDTKIENPEFFIKEFQLPNNVSPAHLSDVIENAVENKIAPNAASPKNAARTASRAKEKLLERGLIDEKNGLVWKMPSRDK